MTDGRCAFVFPGAGIELGKSGEEAALLARHRSRIGPLLERASEFVGADLCAAVERDGLSALSPLGEQALTYAYGLGVARVLEDEGAAPVAVAGHSLGVYAAVVAAGALSFEDGLAALGAAFECARAAAPARCGLLGIVGLGAADVDAAAAGFPSLRRVIANHALSHVVAGAEESLEALRAAVEAEGARARFIDRRVPYHHPELLAGAAAPFRAALDRLGFHAARRPVASTLVDDAAAGRAPLLRDAEELRAMVVRNVVAPIAWEGALRALSEAGARTIFECGPGATLARLGRLVDADLRHVAVRDLVKRAA